MFKSCNPISSPTLSCNSPRSSSIDLFSDDDSYAGVEQISDSEDDDPKVEKAEERAIIYYAGRNNVQENFQLSQDDTWQGLSDYPSMLEDMPLFGEEISVEEEWRMQTRSDEILKDEDEPEERSVSERAHSVDFESSDDEIEMFDDVFPDIFIDKDKLDSSFRRQIDHDDVSDDGSYWEHEDVEAMYGGTEIIDKAIDTIDEDEEYDSDSTLSGHESDMSGETTDDDLPDEYYTKTRRSLARMPEDESEAEEDNSYTPRLYSWKHTSNKPFATVSTNCKKMILFNVTQVSRNVDLESSRQRLFATQQANFASSPARCNFGNMLMTALQNPSPTISAFSLSGTQEAFLSGNVKFNDYTSYGSSSEYDTDDVEEIYGDTITNLDEFINFESDQDTTSDNEIQTTPMPVDTDIPPTQSRHDNSLGEDIHPLIPHFNRGVVGSWRQKQNTHQLLHRNIATPESLAFGGNQFMEGTLKGVKSGRLKHASTPITPARKQRLLNPVKITACSLASSMKRKFDAYDEGRNTHKRSKSFI
ncbi:hypothetical protein K3495_g6929 [Podosphaera aphanis]|nr:hypothetical protein K3495_g6929 [Podosphaera aphanis]